MRPGVSPIVGPLGDTDKSVLVPTVTSKRRHQDVDSGSLHTAAVTTTRSTFKIEDPSIAPGRVDFRVDVRAIVHAKPAAISRRIFEMLGLCTLHQAHFRGKRHILQRPTTIAAVPRKRRNTQWTQERVVNTVQ